MFYMNATGWIARRETLEIAIPEAWNLLCIAIEQAAEQFGWTSYAKTNHLIALAERINSCIHVVVSPSAGGENRSIDICLDQKNRRVFGRDNGREVVSLSLGAAPGFKAGLLEDGKRITNDRASEIFLRPFFFGESVPKE
jgi:hypothetical protein